MTDEEKEFLALMEKRKSRQYAETERGQLAGLRRRGTAAERVRVDRILPQTGDMASGRRRDG